MDQGQSAYINLELSSAAQQNIYYLLIPVFCLLVGVCSDTINIAVNHTATQSSQYYNHPASLAVDGSRDGSMIPGIQKRDGQFSHTNLGSSQWWMVDLGKVFYVYRVRLWNRLGQNGKLQIGWEVLKYTFC